MNKRTNSIYCYEINKICYKAYVDKTSKIIAQNSQGDKEKNWFYSLFMNEIYLLLCLIIMRKN